MHASQIQGCIVKQKVEMRKICRITPFIACVPHSSAQYRYTISTPSCYTVDMIATIKVTSVYDARPQRLLYHCNLLGLILRTSVTCISPKKSCSFSHYYSTRLAGMTQLRQSVIARLTVQPELYDTLCLKWGSALK